MTMVAYAMPTSPPHTSVLVREVTDALALKPGGLYLDVTAGWGGHSEAILETEPRARVIAFDRDPEAVS